MISISLFSGAGGLDIGFEQAGFQTVFANELDHDAAETWRTNRPDHKNIMIEGDIDQCIDQLNTYKNIDVVFGGPPCQGFSVAGKMDPQDTRSRLVWRFMDAVEIVRPKIFIMENVAALGKLSKWASVREGILARGEQAGYNVSYQVHHAADYGVPENRDRVIFIGVRKDIGSFERFYNEIVAHKSTPLTARETLLSAGIFGSPDNPQTCTANVTLALHPVMRQSPYAGMLVNGAGRPLNLDGLAPTLSASMGGNKTPIVDETALHHPNIPNWFVTYHANLINGTIKPASAKVPSTIRRLTIKESAAIQTFPAHYIFCGKKTKQYKQIGNAVPCLFAKAIAQAVRDAYLEVN